MSIKFANLKLITCNRSTSVKFSYSLSQRLKIIKSDYNKMNILIEFKNFALFLLILLDFTIFFVEKNDLNNYNESYLVSSQ
jgi:hypothetical protein